MELSIDAQKIQQYSLYQTEYLNWRVGFDYYINKHKIRNDEYQKPETVYLSGGDIQYRPLPKESSRGITERIIRYTKSKLIQKGISIFKKFNVRIRHKICDEWCKRYEQLLLTEAPIGIWIASQYEHLSTVLDWVFQTVPQIDPGAIPEAQFLMGSAFVVGALFLQANKSFNKICDCEFNKKQEKFKEIEAILVKTKEGKINRAISIIDINNLTSKDIEKIVRNAPKELRKKNYDQINKAVKEFKDEDKLMKKLQKQMKKIF